MATFKPLVLEHHLRDDNTWNVKIRVTHNRKTAYISTEHYVIKKQLNKALEIKDEFLIDDLNSRIKSYRETIVKLGTNVQLYNAKELADYLVKKNTPGSDNKIDFVEFGRLHLKKLYDQGRKRYADNIQTTLSSLIDYFGSERIPITDLTSKTLEKFEEFLRSKRKAKRPGRAGTEVELTLQPLSDIGVINYMTNIRTLFNAAVNEFNDEDKDEIAITHYPFRKYKIPVAPETKKRALKPEIIKLIRDLPEYKTNGSHGVNRAMLGRDIFMLSFYLIGMNTVDLYKIDSYADGRLSYKRSKTASRRQDEAFISIKVEPEAEALIEKYRDPSGKRVFNFYKMYADEQSFNKALNKGLASVSEKLQLEPSVTIYYARHSWATIARNICRISKDDVAAALNHSDPNHKVTDTYLEKDWTIIDEANRKVLDNLIG